MDYSTNADVAVYFACESNPDKDGEIHIISYDERNESSLDTLLISELSLLDEEISMEDFCNSLIKKYPANLSRYVNCWENLGMAILSWLDHGFMVTPTEEELIRLKTWNKRIVRQSGAFYVFGNKTKESYTIATTSEARRCIIIPKLEIDSPIIKNAKYAMRVTISKDNKEEILNFLEQKGINKLFYLPEKK